MRPLKMKIPEHSRGCEAPSLCEELGTEECPGSSPSFCPRRAVGQCQRQLGRDKSLGDGGRAHIITPFERFTPNSSSDYKRKLGDQVIANRES